MRSPGTRPFAVHIHKVKAFIVTALLMCLTAGCSQGPPEKIPRKNDLVEAQIETVQSTPMTVYAVLPGTVVSKDRIEVASTLTGYVYDLQVHEGEYVKKGQVLFSVDPTSVKAEIQEAEAELAKAKAALADARESYERYKNLYDQQAATKEQYEHYERGYKVALGSYQAAEAALASARSQLKYAEVRAPFDGVIVSKLADNGQLAGPGTPVLVLESQNHLQVQAEVDERAFAHLRIDQEIPIQLEKSNFETHTVTGSVERLVTAANPITHTHLVKIGLPADSHAWSGQYALVSIPVGEQEGIMVPAGAIHIRAGITGVFVVTEKDRAQFRMVTLGKHAQNGRVVLSGLFPGDRVVVSAKGPLGNGVKIRGELEGKT